MKRVLFFAITALFFAACSSEGVGGAMAQPPQPADNNKVDTSKLAKIQGKKLKVNLPKQDTSKYEKIKVPHL